MRTLHLSKRVMPTLGVLLVTACAKGDSERSDTAVASAEASAAASAPASTGTSAITADDLRSYRLSMDRVRAYHQAELEWSKSAETRAEARREDDDAEGASTLAQGAENLRRALEKRPATMAEVQKAGFTARDVAIHSMVLAGSSIAAASGDIPPEISAENVAFVKANKAELDRMRKALENARSGSGG